jgi:anti-sigma regulatory factor (Ser/Thr protein kinase)
VTSIRLAAVLTAVGAARAFVRSTLAEWRLEEALDGAELTVSELVTNAVKGSGPAVERGVRPVVGVQLRAAGSSLYVEVWDRGAGTPELRAQAEDAEGGRGLFLVDVLSSRWDVFRPAGGGKVVWAELLLEVGQMEPCARDGAGEPWLPGCRPASDLESLERALTQRVLDGLTLPEPAPSGR